MHRLPLSVAIVTALATGSAFAQGGPATLHVASGSVMISTGGEFTTIASGAQVPGGSRLMLTEGSSVTLVYPDGCTKEFASAGVFNVTGTCIAGGGSSAVAAGAAGAGAVAGTIDFAGLGLLAGGTVAGAAILASMDDVPITNVVPDPPPISP